MRTGAVCILAGLSAALALAGAPLQDETFDSASVKPAPAGQRGSGIVPAGGGLRAQNVTLKQLVAEAWHVYDFQISGGPKWLDTDRFDVDAKASAGARPQAKQLRAMLQKVLADRFALRVRQDSREMAALLLEPVKDGVRVKPAKDPAAPTMFRVFQRRQVTALNAPLDELTNALTWILGKPVVDRTGLESSYDYQVEWAPDEFQVGSEEAPVQTDGRLPSLATALRQQMGLQLVPRKVALALIVVESAEKPAAN